MFQPSQTSARSGRTLTAYQRRAGLPGSIAGRRERLMQRAAASLIEHLERRQLLTVSFAAPVDYVTGTMPAAIVLADLNGDLAPDIVSVNTADNSVSVLLGDGHGGFGAHAEYAAGSLPVAAVAADFNGDGFPDLAVADSGSGMVSILFNNTNGTFAAPVSYTLGGQPQALVAGDFNGDGLMDLAVAVGGLNTVVIMGNVGGGAFVGGGSYLVGQNPSSIVAGDFRGAGKVDLAVANQGDDTVSVLLDNGSGGFAPDVTLPVGRNPDALVAGDFNGDRMTDLAVANNGGNTVTVLLSTGLGMFATGVNYAIGARPDSLATADMDGDGTLDLVAGDTGGGKAGHGVTVLINNGDGTFAPGTHVNVPGMTQGLAVADLDSDGRTDMVLPNPAPPTLISYVDVLMSNRPAPAVTINQADTQDDPTVSSPINFTVVFSAPVTGFTASDVVVGGTAGASIVEVTGSGTTYNVAVSGMTQSGIVFVRIPPNAARDINNNGNLPSVSTDNQVTFEYLAPSVTINQAVSQLDPTNQPTINFSVVFNVPVTGFDSSGVVLGGTAGATTAVVTGSGLAYNVAVSGMTQPGTVIATIPPGVATGANGYLNNPSTSTDNVVDFDNVPPTVTIDQAATQTDPTNGSIVTFTVVFSKPVTGFGPGSVLLGGTAGATTAAVTGSGTTYTVVVTGMTRPGTVIATIPANAAVDVAGNGNDPSTSTDNTVVMSIFTPRFDYLVGPAPQGLTSADFNGDGKPDLVVANTAGDTVSVLINTGGGTFAPHADYITGNGPTAVVAADFNGDGKPDLAVANAAGDTVSVLLNAGAGSFSPRVDYAVGSYPTSIIAADFNGDGKPDLAVTNNNDDTVSVLLNNGDGTFAPAVAYNVGVIPTSVAAADFNGNGLVDLVVATRDTGLGVGGITLLQNTGKGGFAITSSTLFSSYPASVITADFNGDGTPDLALVDSDTNRLWVMLNDGTGAFNTTATYGTGANPVSVTSLDFNGDGMPDLAVTCLDGDTVGVFLNDGTGNFLPEVDYAVGSGPRAVVAADFNGDARTDIAVADNGANKATVLLSNRVAPTARISPATGQANPTHVAPVNFKVVFSAPVTGFSESSILLSGSAGATTLLVTGGGTTYNVAVTGMQQNGSVTISIPANAVTDADGDGNAAVTGPANTITWDVQVPTVTINRLASQPSLTSASPVNFAVVFSKPVTGFTAAGVVLGGTAGATTAVVTGGGMNYNVAVGGMTGVGTVTATILAGVATDAAGNTNLASTSTDNTVVFNNVAPMVTINTLPERPNPTNQTTINFTVIFSKPVTGFTSAGVTLGGTAGATTAIVTGSDNVYNVAVSGMTQPGTVTATIPASVARDIAGNANLASTSTDNTVTFDNQTLTATVDRAVSQPASTNTSPIDFTVVFNKPVTGFANSGVVLGGTAGATTALVTGNGATYNVAVTGMQRNGTVVVTVPAGMVVDAAGNYNVPSTGTGNTVTFDTVAPGAVVRRASAQAASSNAATINFTVVFSEPLAGFGAGDVVLGGSAGATAATVTGSGATYNVAVTGMQQSGTVVVAVPSGVVTDLAGNPNTASTGSANTVAFDNTPPTAALRASAITAASSKPYKFSVIYTDNMAVNAATIGNGDIIVSGPAGRSYKVPATWIRPATPLVSAPSVTAGYSITPPGGTWNSADNGVYTVSLQYKQVSDLAGNSIATGKTGLVIGTFRVGIGVRVAARPAAIFSTTPLVASPRSTDTLFAATAQKPGDVLN
ncbi:MAG: FG-GAP-like repeat-containing protein [Tepidisphaeraceae bacterium]